MKNLRLIPMLLACILVSCSSDLDTDYEQTSTVDAEKSAYMAYVAELENEFPGKTIYHKYNMPVMSADMAEMVANSPVETAVDFEEGTQLRIGEPQMITFGPWGKEKGNTPFKDVLNFGASGVTKRLSGINVTYGSAVNSLQLIWIDENGTISQSPIRGVYRGNTGYVGLPAGDAIIRVRVKHGGYIDSILFESRYNVWVFGGTGGSATADVRWGDSGLEMHGMYGFGGTATNNISQIGFYCYPASAFAGMGY
ncbi:MAG: hypothetical protein E6772_07605 [Dysgonomonas sp.]|nr:hypothetical protein [Dysgonomonas sp.]